MLFGNKRRKNAVPPAHRSVKGPEPIPEYVTITFEMMLKGAVIKRRRTEVRQVGVMVRGSVRLVTSGDTVDRETYEAMLAAKIVAPPQPLSPGVTEED